jgi:hypothetical protein
MKLCKRVKYFKESQEGVASMCQVLEDYVKEKDIQTAINFLKNGVSVSIVVNSIPTLKQDEVEELSRKIENNEI